MLYAAVEESEERELGADHAADVFLQSKRAARVGRTDPLRVPGVAAVCRGTEEEKNTDLLLHNYRNC